MSTEKLQPVSRRILVVANQPVAGEDLHDIVDAEVVVVAPALIGRLGYWTGDDRRSRRDAEERLELSLESASPAWRPAAASGTPIRCRRSKMRSVSSMPTRSLSPRIPKVAPTGWRPTFSAAPSVASHGRSLTRKAAVCLADVARRVPPRPERGREQPPRGQGQLDRDLPRRGVDPQPPQRGEQRHACGSLSRAPRSPRRARHARQPPRQQRRAPRPFDRAPTPRDRGRVRRRHELRPTRDASWRSARVPGSRDCEDHARP